MLVGVRFRQNIPCSIPMHSGQCILNGQYILNSSSINLETTKHDAS